MQDVCSVCGAMTLFDGLVVGAVDGEDGMTLCEDCALVVFPGLSALMRSHCPVCVEGGQHL